MNPYEALQPHWQNYCVQLLNEYKNTNTPKPRSYDTWKAAVRRVCGKNATIEWVPREGPGDWWNCIVAGVMLFELPDTFCNMYP